MKRFAGALGAVLLLLPAGAQAADPGPASQAEAEARINDFARRMAAFAQPYEQTSNAAIELVMTIIDGANQALERRGAGASEAELRPWHRQWAADVRARQQKLRAMQAALPRNPTAALDELGAPPTPTVVALRRAYERAPVAAEELFRTVHKLTDESLPLVERSIGGDPEAPMALAIQVVRGISLSLAAENVMMDVAIAASPTHPQGKISASAKATNEAMMVMLDAQVAELEGGKVDVAALAQTLRGKAAQASASAAEAPVAARQLVATSRSAGMGHELMAKVEAIAASYDGSAKTEARIADLVNQAAERLERGDDIATAAEVALEPLEALVDTRMAEQQERVRQLGL